MHCPNCQNTEILYGSSPAIHVMRVLTSSHKRYCPVCHEKWRVRSKGRAKNHSFYLVTLPLMVITGVLFLKITGCDSRMRNDFMYSHFGLGSPRLAGSEVGGEGGVFGFGNSSGNKTSRGNAGLGIKVAGVNLGISENLQTKLLDEARKAGIQVPKNIDQHMIEKFRNFSKDPKKIAKLSANQRKLIDEASNIF